LAAETESGHGLGPALSTATLSIQHTWNHQPLAEAERTHLRISQHALGVQIAVDAPFFGDVAPPAATGVYAGATPGLWQFEVVEVFFLGHDDRYLEVELSPHGNHLVLALEGVRRVVAEGLPLMCSAQILGACGGIAALRAAHPPTAIPALPILDDASASPAVGALDSAPDGRTALDRSFPDRLPGPRWRGHAFIPAPLLPPDWHRLNAFAIHGVGPRRQYQAWRPAGGSQPDFHVLSAFGFWRDVCR
jgi:hypothetical protein